MLLILNTQIDLTSADLQMEALEASARRWSAVLSAPPSPELLGPLGLGPGSRHHHVCPDGMSDFLVTQSHRQADFQEVQV